MNKISFIPLTEDNADTLAMALAGDDKNTALQIAEIIDGFSCYSDDSDISFAFSIANGCLAVRIFDTGRYFFPFPFELEADGANITNAVESIVYYCIKEEIPITFTDVPADSVSVFTEIGYKHLEIRREPPCDTEELTYRVSVKTECTELCDVPTAVGDRLALRGLVVDDVADYARVSRDTTSLEFWGYDYREDMPNATDEYFYRIAKEEFDIGASLTLGVLNDGKFIGEAVLYAFDAKGGADFAFRLLPEYRGLGLGGELYELTCEIARKIGLDYLMADILKANARSRALMKNRMEITEDLSDKYRYRIIL